MLKHNTDNRPHANINGVNQRKASEHDDKLHICE